MIWSQLGDCAKTFGFDPCSSPSLVHSSKLRRVRRTGGSPVRTPRNPRNHPASAPRGPGDPVRRRTATPGRSDPVPFGPGAPRAPGECLTLCSQSRKWRRGKGGSERKTKRRGGGRGRGAGHSRGSLRAPGSVREGGKPGRAFPDVSFRNRGGRKNNSLTLTLPFSPRAV